MRDARTAGAGRVAVLAAVVVGRERVGERRDDGLARLATLPRVHIVTQVALARGGEHIVAHAVEIVDGISSTPRG